MLRALLVMLSTLIFALLGLLIGYLAVSSAETPRTDLLISGYGVAPVVGALLGFGLSLFTVWLFTPQRTA